MTSIVWPEGLPQVLVLDGLNAKRKTSVVTTRMDAGPAKRRRRYTVSTKAFTGCIYVSDEQRATLENFHKNTLGDGVSRFLMKDPQTLDFSEFRFTDDYDEESCGGGIWKIQMQLEKMNA